LYYSITATFITASLTVHTLEMVLPCCIVQGH